MILAPVFLLLVQLKLVSAEREILKDSAKEKLNYVSNKLILLPAVPDETVYASNLRRGFYIERYEKHRDEILSNFLLGKYDYLGPNRNETDFSLFQEHLELAENNLKLIKSRITFVAPCPFSKIMGFL